MSDKTDLRDERRHDRALRVKKELQSTLLDWQSKKHKFMSEPVGGALAAFHPPDPFKSAGHRIKPFVRGEVLEPIEPIKLHKDTKLVLKDVDRSFKDPIVSPKMQKNLRTLELRLDTEGYLYSPKAFDPSWNWQTQALWFRLIGMGYLQISKKLKLSLNTVKSMFKRLNISKFYPPTRKVDWTTIGFQASGTPSGWSAICYGGASPVLYPVLQINERTGKYITTFNIGQSIKKDYVLKTKEFSLKKHKKEIAKGLKEDIKRRMEVKLEQISVEVENLQKNLAEGFNLETGKYEVVDD